MYCPNCARENSGSEKFCRSCGLKLDFISRVAAAEAAGLNKRAIKGSEEPSLEERKPASRVFLPGFLMFMAGTLVAFLG
ncbi:MAG: zinc-ribbon domain-containing protein, partial [Blastocatellia bacterium]